MDKKEIERLKEIRDNYCSCEDNRGCAVCDFYNEIIEEGRDNG